jgi:hypothetical protein
LWPAFCEGHFHLRLAKTNRVVVILAQAMVFSGLIHAQQQPDAPQQEPAQQEPTDTPRPTSLPKELQLEETQQNASAPCLQPPPMVNWQDYQGPLQKLVGTFGRKLDRKSTHMPHYKPGDLLCSLEIKDKFMLFIGDTLDPVSFLSSGFNAATDQATNVDPSFGQGMKGYGRRLVANVASDTTGRFLGDFVYPTIFGEDPRYYRLAHGPKRDRLFHAMEHVVVAHRDSGTRMFNFNEWFTLATAVVINNFYHPGNTRGFVPAAEGVGIALSIDMGTNIAQEFWPEIARKLKMPFRGIEPPTVPASPAGTK